MVQRVFTHKKTNKKLIAFDDREFEMENPIKQYGNHVIVKQMILNGVPKAEMTGEKPFTASSSDIFKSAHLHWLNLKSDFQKINIPGNLMQLLKTDIKTDQEKLPELFLLPQEVLTAFIFKGYHEFGYTLSQYISRDYKKGSKSVAKIIDCGVHWYCFLTTSNDLKKNIVKFHYLSNTFGIDRADLVKQIKSGESFSKLNNLSLITL
ncbi:hypothetical protein [Flavivirga spongiicola]|uniref:Uncharacterized protein n=1 Tax=Flavivirga spongiicola TaxID=421621 RepID=A0ABU7XR18_9FLAO|nr:hypothetical protein [Flavivirga sp. MEBiC05379]MDO5978205.1 hypothetical protein [Flavivirga sp. MEBiC05379]